MYTFIIGYEVRDNDATNYGRDFPVAIIHVSKIVKTDKDAFERVYMDDETYYYPRRWSFILRYVS